MPRLTIAIPTLRRRAYLEEAVRSAQGQSETDIEIIVSQDAMADGTLVHEVASWAATLPGEDTRVRYVAAQDGPLGLAGNWNRVADLARGEFLTIIGDDDRLLPEFGSCLLAAAGDADVVFANHHIIGATGFRQPEATARATARFQRDRLRAGRQEPAADCVWRNAVPMSASIIRTALVRRLRFAEDLNTPDIDFFARAAADGARFCFVPGYLAEYRVHPSSATSAGLTMAALVNRLASIPVPPSVDRTKTALMREFTGEVLRLHLIDGDVGAMRQALASPYAVSRTGRSLGWLARIPVAGDALLAGASRLFRIARRAAGRT